MLLHPHQLVHFSHPAFCIEILKEYLLFHIQYRGPAGINRRKNEADQEQKPGSERENRMTQKQ
jgi:hypothetical protein